jgi:predicted transposase/invertase (TIGR01784 family)
MKKFTDRFLDPKNDIPFKKLFGSNENKGILLAFLNDIFSGVYPKIEEVTPLSPNHIPEVITMAQSFVDVSCRDEEGNRYIVEMQCYSDSDFLQRACFYSSRAYINQKTEKRGYHDLNPVRFLAILKKSILPKEEMYLTHNQILSLRTYQCHMKQFSYSFLELGKIDKQPEECENMVEMWAYFFNHAPEVIAETLAKIAKEYPVIKQAFDVLERFKYTREEQERYDVLDMKADSLAVGLSDAEKMGEAKGEIKATQNMVIELHKQGVDKEIITKASGLSLEEVEQMLAEGDKK